MTYQPARSPVPMPLAQGWTEGAPPAVAVARGWYPGGGKRVLDLLLVGVALPAALVLLGVLAGLLLLSGARPFFGHERLGRDGRRFRCWKLRTMGRDAEAQLARHLAEDPEAAREWAASQKLQRDPRVTRIGRFLRRSSLDELPQLWNVLRGEMSLVGPRPVTAAELVRYGLAGSAYLAVWPGITGPWQVGGRNRLSYAERVALDADYARGCCLRRDLAILLRTVPAVLQLGGR